MSWKLFGQIALLMVIAVLLLITLKFACKGIYHMKYRTIRAKMAQSTTQKTGNRGMMKSGYVK